MEIIFDAASASHFESSHVFAGGSLGASSEEHIPLGMQSLEFNFEAESELDSIALWRTEPKNIPVFVQQTKKVLHQFDGVLADRLSYLDKLPSIGDDWISGPSVAPSEEAVKISKSVLSLVRTELSRVSNMYAPKLIMGPIPTGELSRVSNMYAPKLIMGPIPTGGVSLELRKDEDNAIYVSISNDAEVELDIQYNGHFTSIEIDAEKLPAWVADKYAIER